MLKRKWVVYLGFAVIFGLLSGISAWRLLAWSRLDVLAGPVWLAGWAGLTVILGLFWTGVIYLSGRFGRRVSLQQGWTALLGAILLGGGGWLLMTPAGWSRLSLELSAGQVWSPDMFIVTWENEGLWETPLTLVGGRAVTGTLEVAPAGSNQAPGEVWLVDAKGPAGSPLAPAYFELEPGWQRQEINWRTYQNHPIWIASAQAGTLRWQGALTGPLTLVFAQHEHAGRVVVRWNEYEQIFDLHAPGVTFRSVTIPVNGPVVWRAELPFNAVGQEIGLELQGEPGGMLPVLQKITLTGIPGQPVSVAGTQLAGALEAQYSRLTPAEAGVQFVQTETGTLPFVFLKGPLAPNSAWGRVLPWLENSLASLYLAVLGGLLPGVWAGHTRPAFLARFNLVVTGVLVGLALGEVSLAHYLPAGDKYYALQPNQHVIFKPYPAMMPGISGDSHYITNSEGIRGDEISPDDDYQILIVGGSAAQCIYLDQTEAWPQRLQTYLNQARLERQVWVGNVGKSGHTSYEHIAQLHHLLPQYPNLDAVIVLTGVNDFGLVTKLGEAYGPDHLTWPGMRQAILSRAFDIRPRLNPGLLPHYKFSGIWRILANVRQDQNRRPIPAIQIEDEAGKNYINRRQARQAAVIEEELPDLANGLAAYRHNINTMIDIAQAHDVRLILLTQPAMWRADLPQAEQKLLWFGWRADRKVYYSVSALAEGMAAHNKALLDVCRQRQVECLDVASVLPQDTTVFYDDVHFNESGAAQVARLLAGYLLQGERRLVLTN